jgi:uncharacterized protein YgiM (DUF1202 family)
VVQVLSQGTTVVIVGKKHGWFKVQLPDGSVGWVVSYGVSAGTTAGGPSTTAVSGTNGVPSAPATGTNTLVGTQTAPVRQGSPKQRRPTTRSTVNGLRVHAAPSTDAPVVGTMSQNQKVTVLARSNGWMKVRLPDGTVGWVMASYTSGAHSAAAPPATPTYRTVAPKPRPARTYRGGHTVNVAVNLRSGPSLSNSVITVVQPGQTYQVLGYANGWVHVQLANGTVGWIKASLVSSQSTTGSRSKGTRPTYRSYAPSRPQRSARRPTSAGGSVLTAGVRVHSRPGVNTPVVTLAAAGTRVQVLGSSGGWALVRLPSGTTGYVLGSYVR